MDEEALLAGVDDVDGVDDHDNAGADADVVACQSGCLVESDRTRSECQQNFDLSWGKRVESFGGE